MAIILSDSHNSGGHMYGHKASSEHGEVEHTDRQGISFLDIGGSGSDHPCDGNTQ